jgi:hypothetical protein
VIVDENANVHGNLLNHNIGHPTKTMVFFPFSSILIQLGEETPHVPSHLGEETTHVPSHLDEKLPLYLPSWVGNYPYTFPLLLALLKKLEAF